MAADRAISTADDREIGGGGLQPPGPGSPKQYLTLRGYAHLRFETPDSTDSEEFVVAGVNGDVTTSSFGSILVVDDPFRATDAADSALVGRIKGHGVNTDINSTSNYLTLHLTLLIDYNSVKGSVIVEGTRVGADAERTLAITGGTGDFALARGVATQIAGPQGTDDSGAVVIASEWRLRLLREPNGPDTNHLAYMLHPLVVQAQAQWTGDGRPYQGATPIAPTSPNRVVDPPGAIFMGQGETRKGTG